MLELGGLFSLVTGIHTCYLGSSQRDHLVSLKETHARVCVSLFFNVGKCPVARVEFMPFDQWRVREC